MGPSPCGGFPGSSGSSSGGSFLGGGVRVSHSGLVVLEIEVLTVKEEVVLLGVDPVVPVATSTDRPPEFGLRTLRVTLVPTFPPAPIFPTVGELAPGVVTTGLPVMWSLPASVPDRVSGKGLDGSPCPHEGVMTELVTVLPILAYLYFNIH